MSCPCQNPPAAEAGKKETKPERYVSFVGLDCDAKAAELMRHIRRYIDDPAHSNAFWEYFKKKAEGGSGPRPDDLFLVHSNLNQIRELFEDKADPEALALLDRIEQECC
ncbi:MULTISPECIES: N(2)-fixation sustaining protein CowN [Uliginosibacterium]|uniref:N(2)-fixation sustaining protein CowN n=1 Tax=Uliginosibacterium aquaticum TaxID=2731212 RepID=A0ABX2IH00_9RHOO|nr:MULTISPECIES: N(2)-fixation sustaining protein CowN [Uliginosibacterium]MDO6387193.1 N(2)-fixation sustaining protein CowN [Uliginosibacterium sp. 31-12]NSL56043.1 N(2)-fixation sustaining protein CowN [Uliginosibacterium aquaticum]